MSQKLFCFVLCATLLVLSFPAEAQQGGKVYRIGYLKHTSGPGASDEAFLQTLRDLGWIEGKNISIEYRWAARTRELISPMVLSLIMASCIVTKPPISHGKKPSRTPRRN